MQEMIAHVAAAVVASLLFLAVGVLVWRMQHHSIDSVQFRASKTQELESLGRTLEEDFANLGAGLTRTTLETSSAFAVYEPASGNYQLTTWTARDGRADDIAADDGDIVRYEVRAVTGADVQVRAASGQFVTVPTVRVTRTEAGRTAVYGGLLEAHVRLYDKSGLPTSTKTLGCEVEVVVRQVSPLGGGTAGVGSGRSDAPHVDQTRWVRRFRPANLTRAAACRP